jgi:hypothetical protein
MGASLRSLLALVGSCVSLLMVTSCGESQTPVTPAMPGDAQGRLGQEMTAPGSGARAQDLLYVSNREDGSVSMYSFPKGTLAGRKKGARTKCGRLRR